MKMEMENTEYKSICKQHTSSWKLNYTQPESLHLLETPAGSTHSSTRGLRPTERLERQAEFHYSDKTRPDSPVPTLQGPCGRSQKWRGSLRFLPPIEMRPSFISSNLVESREAPLTPQCRGPAPADPGYSKRGRRRRPIYIYLFIKYSKSNRIRIAQWGNSVEKSGWNKDSSVGKFSGEKKLSGLVYAENQYNPWYQVSSDHGGRRHPLE